MSKTILINRALELSEIDEIKRLAACGSEVFSVSGAPAYDFAQRISLSSEEKKQVNYQTMADVLQFGDFPVGEQTLADLFRIDTASIWHYQKFRTYFTVRNLMYFLKPLIQRFSSFHDQLWFVSADLKVLRNLYPEVDFRFPETKVKSKINFGDLFSYLVLTKYRFFRFVFSRKNAPEYLVYLPEKYSTVLDKETLQTVQGHHVLEYLIDGLDRRFGLLTEVLMPKPKGKSDYSFSWKQFESFWKTKPKFFLEGILISGLLKSRVRNSVTAAHKKLQKAYPEVQNSELTTTQQLAFEVFRSLDKSSVFFLYRYFSARSYFAHSGTKAVIAADENSPLTKSILDAARFCGIRIIGLQHGTMHDLHPAYLYTLNDRKNKIMPDVTLSWGDYWKEFLIEKGNYPEDSVVPVGQIRTDVIPKLLENEKLKPAKSMNTIVFASQPQRDPELRYQAAFDVFKAACELPKVQLIVKLHPREYADESYYANIAKEAGCTNFTIDTSSDLYELIARCQVLITCFSTVGTETVYFHKPLIILDHLKQDIMGYLAEGVAFQATDSDSLLQILSGIFAGTLNIDRGKYDSFIRKYACQIDGKVAERCIEVITG